MIILLLFRTEGATICDRSEQCQRDIREQQSHRAPEICPGHRKGELAIVQIITYLSNVLLAVFRSMKTIPAT